jgi:hypothetical protein
MQACYCGVAFVVNDNSAQPSVITQQGQNLKLKGCYCFLEKKLFCLWISQKQLKKHKILEYSTTIYVGTST